MAPIRGPGRSGLVPHAHQSDPGMGANGDHERHARGCRRAGWPAGRGGGARCIRAHRGGHRGAGGAGRGGRRDHDQPDPRTGQGVRDHALRDARQGSPDRRDPGPAGRVRRRDRAAGTTAAGLRAGRAGGVRRGGRHRGDPAAGRLPGRQRADARGSLGGHGRTVAADISDTDALESIQWGSCASHRDGPPPPADHGGGDGGAGRGGGRAGEPAAGARGGCARAGPAARSRPPGSGRTGRGRPADTGAHALRHAERQLLPGGHRPGAAAAVAGGLDADDRRDGQPRAGDQLRRAAPDAADRGRHHPGLRVEPGRRHVQRQRSLARGAAGPGCCAGPGYRPAPTRCCPRPPTG
jgi:hypothetical protein